MARQNRNRNILCWKWNIRGMNSEDKWRSIRGKVEESKCSIICLQETKRASFDHSSIKNFATRHFDKFVFFPADGAYGGIITLWNSDVFSGNVIHQRPYALTVEFKSTQTSDTWFLLNIYGPCDGKPRDDFVNWLFNLHVADDKNWIFLGNFNFIRSMQNRNRPGGNMTS